MIVAVDLHIHTGLSPCGDKDMTPNNIVNMAKLKKLDVIAITDHNSVKNVEVVMEVAKGNNLLCIPGIEITTKEEVHLITLFSRLENAKEFQKIVDAFLPKVKNKSSYFGRQFVYDREDRIIDEEERLLMSAVDLTLEKAVEEARKCGGLVMPAHVDRESYSILSNLGFIGEHLDFTTIEISRHCEYNQLLRRYPYLGKYNILQNSDAHCLGDILEGESLLRVSSFEIEGILDALRTLQ